MPPQPGLPSSVLSRLKKLASNKTLLDTTLYMSGNLFSQGISFLILPIFTHYLSPEDFGIYNYTNSIKSVLAVVTTLSLNSFVLRYYFKLNTEEEKKKLASTTFLFLLGFSGLLLLVEYIGIPVLIRVFSIRIPFDPYFSLTVINIFLETAIVIPMVLLRVRRKALAFVGISLAHALLTIALGLIFVISFKWGLVGRYYGILIANILFMLIYLFCTFNFIPVSFDLSFLKKGMRFSAPLLPAAIATMALACLDRVWLERYVSLSQLGIYTTAFTLGTALLIITRAFYMAVEPEIFASFERSDFNQRVLVMKNRFVLTITLIGAIMIIFSKEAVEIFLAPSFLDTYKIIPFFVVVSVLRASRTLVTTVFHAFNKTNYEFYIMVVGLLIGVISNMVLIPHFGVYGAAAASIITFSGIQLVSFLLLKKISGLKWDIAYELLLIVGIIGASLLIMQIGIASILGTMILKVGTGAVVLAALFLVNAKYSNLLARPTETG